MTKAKTTTGKAVAKPAETAVAMDDLTSQLMADADLYRHSPGPEMVMVPRVSVLQDLSPECKAGEEGYVEGARPGLFFNEMNARMSDSLIITPFDFAVRYIAWKPRTAGGGLVDPNLTREEVAEHFEQEKIGKWTGLLHPQGERDPVRVEVIQTPEWLCVAKAEGWGPMPVALSMPSTKVKAAKKMNTAMLMEVQVGDKVIVPPMFYHQFVLETAIERDGQDSWYGLKVRHLGAAGVPDANPEIDLEMVRRARDQRKRYDEGALAVDDSTLRQ